MGFRQNLIKIARWPLEKAYRLGVPGFGGGFQLVEMNTPPSWSYQSYLKAYGEIGWLYACVNVIAQAVARTPWHLYQLEKDGERGELTQHPLIDLLNHMNPFQSRYQFFYLGTMYKLLVGEQFWQINFNGQGNKAVKICTPEGKVFERTGQPAEIWLAPPAFMSVIPSAEKYIDHYEYRRTGMDRPIPFTVDEIIHIKTPNPYNEFRGLSPAQALTVDLDTERYASRYQQRLFFNDATPGFVLEYPAEGLPNSETRKELLQEWDERYRGFRNRGKVAFLWGAKANRLTMTNQDMDFENLRKFNRDTILGAYHVPHSVVGITENVNRANAEAGHYTFAMYTVQPELAELREALNKELCPLFGDDLYLDFENPVPEDKTANVNNAVTLFKGKIINRNEARIETGFDPLDTPDGEEFFTDPVSTFGNFNNPSPEEQNPEPQSQAGKIRKGGEGSGNFGHAGRPGEVGGSGEGGGGGEEANERISSVGGRDNDETAQRARNVIRNIPESHMETVVEIRADKEFIAEYNKKYKTSAWALHRQGEIILGKGAEQQLDHEIGHAVFDKKIFIRGNNDKYKVADIYNASLKTGKGFPSGYSRSSVKEFFSESYAAYNRNPKAFTKLNPPMAKILNSYWKSI